MYMYIYFMHVCMVDCVVGCIGICRCSVVPKNLWFLNSVLFRNFQNGGLSTGL